MNFFDDDFGLGSSPMYPSKKNPSFAPSIPVDQLSRKSNKSAKKDEFDDLLDDLLSKEEKKQNKKKERQVQPYSSTQLEFGNDFKRTQKWSTPNIDPYRTNQSPKFKRNKMTSFEDRGSEDGRSYKSGFTGNQKQFQFDNLMTLRGVESKEDTFVERSSRNMMRPPLAKSRENFNKQTSVVNDDVSIKFSKGMPQSNANFDLGGDRVRSRSREKTQIIQNKNMAPSIALGLDRERSVSPDRSVTFDRNIQEKSISFDRNVQPEVKEKIIEREKIVTVRQDATELKKQFESEVKQIRESFERQIREIRQNWKSEIEESKRSKESLKKEYQTRLEEQRIRLENINSENLSKIKDVHEWEMKKTIQSYELQLQKIGSLSKLEETMTKQQNSFMSDQHLNDLRNKEREISLEKKKLEDAKYELEQRQKNLSFEEENFHRYRNREQEKLHMERKSLMEKETFLKKAQMEQKRVLTSEKQKVATELAEAELEVHKKRQAVQLQREELRMARDLFDKEQKEFQNFSRNIMADYKSKLREIDSEKEKVSDLQIQLYKKIQIVDLTNGQRGGLKVHQKREKSVVRAGSNRENQRNRANTVVWAQETKNRYHQIEGLARKSAMDLQDMRIQDNRVELEGYINRLNRAMTRH